LILLFFLISYLVAHETHHCEYDQARNSQEKNVMKKELLWDIGRFDFSKEQKLQYSQLNTTPTKT